MADDKRWHRIENDEYPPYELEVWTTDRYTVRRGTIHLEPGQGFWTDGQGNPIKVTDWMFLEDSAEAPPAPPTDDGQ
jgi:hypothetical protein